MEPLDSFSRPLPSVALCCPHPMIPSNVDDIIIIIDSPSYPVPPFFTITVTQNIPKFRIYSQHI